MTDKNLMPAAPGSPLATLRARREAALAALHIDLKVPRYDEDGGAPVYVRYAPIPMDRVQEAQKKIQKSKMKDAIVVVNASLLADACQGVFTVVDGEKVSIDHDDQHGDWPRFDDRLAELLGAEAANASEVVRALYFTDGDVLATASELSTWSGYTGEDVDREQSGN